MAFLRLIDQGIGAACRAVLYVTLGVVFCILSANVALRYVAGTSIASASELPELLFPWMIMAGVVLAAQHGSHIAVVILTQKLGPSRRWVLAAGNVAVALMYGGLAIAGLSVMEIAADESTPILHVPGSVSVGCVLLGFALLAVVSLCRLPEVLAGHELPHGHDEAEPAAAHQGV
jgi:TRAP-type C4-dicarboxylate transport system permease small subunit